MLDTLGFFSTEHSNTMAHTKEQFAQAENYWDLENLYIDLASVKGKNLTPIEKRHLRGLLCGCSPSEIAEKLNKSVKGLEVDLSNTIYSYVKILINRHNEKVENWRNISQWLEESGYKSQSVENPSKSTNPIQVNAKVHIENITIDENNNNIEIGILIQLPFTTK
jgi:hypothetical protein